jgi:hypothetical protein
MGSCVERYVQVRGGDRTAAKLGFYLEVLYEITDWRAKYRLHRMSKNLVSLKVWPVVRDKEVIPILYCELLLYALGIV